MTVLANISLRHYVNNASTKSFDNHFLAIIMLLMISGLFSSEVLIYSYFCWEMIPTETCCGWNSSRPIVISSQVGNKLVLCLMSTRQMKLD